MNKRSFIKAFNRLIFGFLLFNFALSNSIAMAADSPASNEISNTKKSNLTRSLDNYEIELQPLSVFGNRIYDPVAEPTQIPLNNQIFTDTITKKDIELRTPYNATELVSFISPAVLRTNQNRKYKTFFDIRGGKVSLALDGFVIQDGSSNTGMRGDDRILEFLNTDIIDSIELMKDSTGLIYGTAKGGVINIKTKRPAVKKSQLKLSAGTFGEFSSKFNTTDIINNKSSYILGVNYRSFDGPDGKNASDQNKGIFFKYYNDITPDDNIALTYNRDIGMFQIPIDEPGISGQAAINPAFINAANRCSIVIDPRYGWYYGPWVNTFSDFNYLKTWNKNQSTNIQLSRLEVTNDFHNPRGVNSTPIGHIDGHHVLETTTTMALRHTIKADNNVIYRFGYYLDHWYNPTGKLYWENRNNEDKKHSFYAQTEIPIVKEKLTFDAGIRRDKRYIIREDKIKGISSTITSIPVENRWEDPRTNYATGLTYKPNTNDTLSLRYSNIIMTPVDRSATNTQTTELADEKDKIINFGVEHNIPNIKIPLSISYNYYKNDMQNAIVTDKVKTVGTTAITTYKNQSTVAKGNEIKLTAKIKKGLEASIGAGLVSYTPENLEKPTKLYNLGLKYMPENSGFEYNFYGRYVGEFNSYSSYNYYVLNANGTIKTNNQGKSITEGTNTADPYKVGKFWDLGLSITKKLDRSKPDSDKITLSIKNILNKRYETMPLSADYGRRVIVGYEMNF